MSDWIMNPRNDLEVRLHLAGYRVTYNSACMYETVSPMPNERRLYYGPSQEDAWTAAYQHNQKRGDVPLGLLELVLVLVRLYEQDEYPSVDFAFKLTDMRDSLKEKESL